MLQYNEHESLASCGKSPSKDSRPAALRSAAARPARTGRIQIVLCRKGESDLKHRLRSSENPKQHRRRALWRSLSKGVTAVTGKEALYEETFYPFRHFCAGHRPDVQRVRRRFRCDDLQRDHPA